jgi:hypothetical protein
MSDRGPSPPGATESATPANHGYYFDTGVGRWRGVFTFQITDWWAFLDDRIGPVNRFLVLAMALTMRLVGEATITSVLEGYPDEEPAGVVTNEVRITLFGITLYLLDERYVMHPDGRGVTVDSHERFGPIPYLFTVDKAHPAEVVEDGRHAVYYMPLLGTDWVGNYRVVDGGDRIESVLSCDWAEGTEVIERVG